MRHIISVFSILMALTFAFNASAQMSKSEQKEWKKRIKSLTPQQYKALLEENKSLKGQLSSLKKDAAGFDTKLKEKDDQISDYQDQISSMRSELAAAKRKAAAGGSEGGSIARSSGPIKGIVFKVQIGAFKQKDLKEFAKNNPSFEVDDDNGTLRYTVGLFRDYWEADTFKKYLREMGVKGAWIVAYKDGKRVPIKDVLEGVI
ncbi:SPOR domain-containing protein [Reichenbachiella versicolor]|uniref:SPOR domain-containing protein n=1 Tax=Reichenbachiella versicolor TaxID=1821036 RepID=UPI001FEACD17|nr:SPOR domain-containing protein [Reichenbachiella versicolor]